MKIRFVTIAITITSVLLACQATAQSTNLNLLTPAQIADKVQELKKQAAAGNGSAAVKLEEYPNHFTMLSYRAKSGGGEVHEQFADIFYVVSGSATLMTGGTLVDVTTAGPGELRGSAVTGKTETGLHQGDIVHIEAHTPHQLLLASGQELVYYVVKVRE